MDTRRIATAQKVSPVDAARARRRDEIVRAAIVVFRRLGFHVATTRDIAEEAGLTQSNLYNYIESKDQVLFLVCDHLIRLYNDAVARAVDAHSDGRDRLLAALEAITRLMSEHRDELQLLYNETHALKKEQRRLILGSVSELIGSFESLLAGCERQGVLKLRRKRVAANLLTFVPAMLALRSWDLNAHCRPGEAERAIIQFLVAGLGLGPQDEAPASGRTSARGPRNVS